MQQGRMRWAIWGPIIGFVLLYFVLRFAVNQLRADRSVLEEYGVSTLQEAQIAELTGGITNTVTADAAAVAAPGGTGVITGTMTVTQTGVATGTVATDAAAVTTTTVDATAVTTTTVDATAVTTTTVEAGAVTTTTVDAGETGVTTATVAVADSITATVPVTAAAPMTATVDAVVAPTSPLADTTWVMHRLNGADVVSGWPITAVFDSQGNVIGSAGCNYYNSSYIVDGAHLSVAVPTSTRMLCPATEAMMQENSFLTTLTEIDALQVDNGQLILTSPAGGEIRMTSVTALGAFVWQVDSYRIGGETQSVPADHALTALIDDATISGFDGCRNYSARFTVEGEIVVISAPDYTAGTAVCKPGGDLEQQAQSYAAALQAARIYELSPEQLRLYDENRTLLVVLTAATPR